MENLKVFYVDINEDDDSGMDGISLVKEGAVQVDFLCFGSEKDPIQLNFFEEDQRIITGVVARADYPIYRRNGDYEYYVVFTKEVIRKLIRKYSKRGLFNRVNLDHNNYAFVKDVCLTESFIVDKSRGICPKEFENIEDGSWICSFYVEDTNLWNEIKNNDSFNAFSLQGLFHLIPEDDDVVEIEKQEHSEDLKEDTFEEWLDNLIEESKM